MTKYSDASNIVEIEAMMMAKGNRPPATSIRWLREAIEILEACQVDGEKQ